ncbi:MAG: flagellar hook capping FlgD N-terminal domain-containing protein [Planctomycetaceae bacterium]
MNVAGFDPQQSAQQFLELMVAQIQYQDPLNPVSQENVTAQLAQISTVSGIGELNLQFGEMLKMQTLFNGAQFVGQNVEYTSPLTGDVSTGVISEARVVSGALQLSVNNETIALSDVQAVVGS